ncbi:MAG: hypothetical protein R3B72_31360 [Polyangiaceae bacterium]
MRRGVLLGLLLAACGGEGAILPPAPRGEGAGGAGGDGLGAGGTGGQPPTGIVREVYQRNPHGHVAVTDNLLFDGDFEWASSFADQYGWYQAENEMFAGYGGPKTRMGALCRSGIKCAALEGDDVALGLGLAAANDGIAVEVWGRPEGGDCLLLEGFVVEQDAQSTPIALSVDGEVDAEGWCHYVATSGQRAGAIYLYLHNTQLGPTVIIDDAVARPLSSVPDQARAQAGIVSSGPMDPELLARVHRFARETQEPKIPPKGEIERGLERRLRRPRRTSR